VYLEEKFHFSYGNRTYPKQILSYELRRRRRSVGCLTLRWQDQHTLQEDRIGLTHENNDDFLFGKCKIIYYSQNP
jgi:hypothetical protein